MLYEYYVKIFYVPKQGMRILHKVNVIVNTWMKIYLRNNLILMC